MLNIQVNTTYEFKKKSQTFDYGFWNFFSSDSSLAYYDVIFKSYHINVQEWNCRTKVSCCQLSAFILSFVIKSPLAIWDYIYLNSNSMKFEIIAFQQMFFFLWISLGVSKICPIWMGLICPFEGLNFNEPLATCRYSMVERSKMIMIFFFFIVIYSVKGT